ncbi:MAG TPA: hypothetical protein DC047_13420 [Blastocatellia bacterium]|nr:hypothetical protein [Blastocatellia bacterium]
MLEGVSAVVASGGQLPMRYVQSASRELSARSKGVRQGAMLMLSTILIVPIIAILTVSLNIFPHIFVPLVAISCFVGGLLRMLYALMMEDANPPSNAAQLSSYAPPAPQQLEGGRPIASAQASFSPAQTWKPRPNTAEIFTPPSVTENTTRLLQKEEPEDR